MPWIDAAAGLERIRGNKKLYTRLLKSYLGTINIDKIGALLEANDIPGAAVEAHTLKGVSANLSVDLVYKCSLALELSLKAGNRADEEFAALKKAVDETIPVINNIVTLWQEG